MDRAARYLPRCSAQPTNGLGASDPAADLANIDFHAEVAGSMRCRRRAAKLARSERGLFLPLPALWRMVLERLLVRMLANS